MSLDHFVRTRDQSWLDFDAERLGSFQIDYQLEYRRAFDWQLSRLLSLQNTINVVGEPSIGLRESWSVGIQCARTLQNLPNLRQRGCAEYSQNR